MRMSAKPRLLLGLLMAIFSANCLASDKGHPASDVVAESKTTTCKDENSGRAGINPEILSGDEADFVLPTQWRWEGSGFDDVLPEIDLDPSQTYVFHVTQWNVTAKDVTLKNSAWYAYRTDGTQMKQSYRQTATENVPYLYGDKSLLLVSVQKLESVDTKLAERSVTTNYKLSIKQKTAQNIANLVAVGEALLGVKGSGGADFAMSLGLTEKTIPVCVETFSIHGGHPPYDVTAEAAFTFPDPSKPAAGAAPKPPTGGEQDQLSQSQQGTGSPTVGEGLPAKKDDGSPKNDSKPVAGGSGPPATGCCTCTCCRCDSAAAAPPSKAGDAQKKDSGSISRTFSILDKEYWDINLGLNIPSVNQPSFTLSKDNVVQRSISKKFSPYAFLSIYPFASISPKDGDWPHFNFGLPVAGQPLHRPFGGVAEKIPWLDRYTGIPISVFGGVVALKESISTLPIGPTSTPAQFALRSHWVWKGMFGLEFPVSSLISKIGKK
jgi:hypothetical protein